MPSKDSIRPDTGTIYFAKEGETLVPLGEVIQEATFEPAEGIQEATFEPAEGGVIPFKEASLNGTINLTEEVVAALRGLTATEEVAWQAIKTALETIKTKLDEYPNRRIVHLALHHRDPLVRKKNIKRIMRGD